jgi:hypothetical protein
MLAQRMLKKLLAVSRQLSATQFFRVQFAVASIALCIC